MKELFRQYIISLYNDVPAEVYEGLLSILCLASVTIFAFYGLKRGWRKVAGVLLVEYVFLIYSSTVFFRTFSESVGHNFHPFWSYLAIQQGGREDLISENIMNVVVFVTVGLLLGSLLRGKGSWLIALAVGLCISGSIETLQYFFHRGFSEVDDVMHNTLGCILGYGMYKLLQISLCRIHDRKSIERSLEVL